MPDTYYVTESEFLKLQEDGKLESSLGATCPFSDGNEAFYWIQERILKTRPDVISMPKEGHPDGKYYFGRIKDPKP